MNQNLDSPASLLFVDLHASPENDREQNKNPSTEISFASRSSSGVLPPRSRRGSQTTILSSGIPVFDPGVPPKMLIREEEELLLADRMPT
jgi:hypothetical protein